MTCGPEVHIDFDTSMYPGCDCASECDDTSCACIIRYGPNYDNRRRLLKTENTAGMFRPILIALIRDLNSSIIKH